MNPISERQPIPYGKQTIAEEEIAAVIEVLRSDWLTTGPCLDRFEQDLAAYLGVTDVVAVANGTAALHAMLYAAGIGPGDEVIVPPLTFAATANAVIYVGARPVFVDVDPTTLLINPGAIDALITSATKAVLAVDYAGQPCDYGALRQVTDKYSLLLLADSCHSLGGTWHGQPCGTQADMSVFSFHPVKPMTTAEGGAVVCHTSEVAGKLRCFRSHGITTDHHQRQEQGSWFYEMTELGWNYRLSELHAALGIVQLGKLDSFTARRQHLAVRYDAAFEQQRQICPLALAPHCGHSHHLYVVRVPHRDQVFQQLRTADILVNVHYIPVYLHPWYRQQLGTAEGLCPIAEQAAADILSLPIYPGLSDDDQDRVIRELINCVTKEDC
ncbi:UDP-4-amino-4,6-dideoxy-N-acetyl-beta-L-altrosamine transaminase [bacterium]|nr:MAG: UDP-4-amino-4,6-dideoxy-N-acetyl-beta-L-altrosamine transaminase [bacterium]